MQLNTWIESLIWCPSQCSYYFVDPKTDKHYCAYLRWRWTNPWEVWLVPTEENGDFKYTDDDPWEEITEKLDKEYKDTEIKELEEACINYLNERFPDSCFSDKSVNS